MFFCQECGEPMDPADGNECGRCGASCPLCPDEPHGSGFLTCPEHGHVLYFLEIDDEPGEASMWTCPKEDCGYVTWAA